MSFSSVRQRTGRQETIMAKAGTLLSFCYDSTHSDPHVLLSQAMNESDREEQTEKEVSHENGEHEEVEDEVTYSSSGDENFASESISMSKH